MFESDYLMNAISKLIQGIIKSMEQSKKKINPRESAEMLELSVGDATGIDGSLVLNLTPDSIAMVIQTCGVDPKLITYVAHSLALAGHYREQAGDTELAELRKGQAHALAKLCGFELPDIYEEEAMEDFLADK